MLAASVGDARFEVAHRQVELPACLLGQGSGDRQENVGRLNGFASGESAVPRSRARLLRSHANPGDCPVAPETCRREIVAQQKVDSSLPQCTRSGLGAEVGIVDRTDREQVEGFVRLAGVAIEVNEPRLDDGGAEVIAFGVGEQRDGPARRASGKGERRLFERARPVVRSPARSASLRPASSAGRARRAVA